MGNLMSDKTTLDVIDRTLQSVEQNFKQFIEVLEKAKNELINLEKEKELLSNDKESLETKKIQLEQDKTKLENDKLTLENETRKLAIEKQERDQKIGSMTEEQKRLLKE